MFKQTLIFVTLAAACTLAPAQSSPAKKELVGRILKLQQPGIEAIAHDLAKQPASELIGSALEFVQNQAPADKREALAKGLQQDADKYMNETFPMVRDRAVKLAPTTVGALLEEKFSEDELKHALAMMESPVYQKFQSLGNDMQRSLIAKLVPELKPQVEPKLKALDDAIAKRLGVPAALAGNQPAAAPAAPAAPKKK
jgi:hypothetical protein